MKFNISELDGIKFAKKSGDKNKIHIDELTGYNSLFSEKICHGALVLTKIFKTNLFKKKILANNEFNLNVEFLDYIKYKVDFHLKKKGNSFYIFQEKKKKISINFSKKNYYCFKKKLKNNKKYIKKIPKPKKDEILFFLIENISKYIGNIYPGKNSILKSININCKGKFHVEDKKFIIKSLKIDRRAPVIENILTSKNFDIEFISLMRPHVRKNKFKINRLIKEKIKKNKYKILIIGGSSGLGNDFLRIFKSYKKNHIIATYFKNKINFKSNNLSTLKVDIFKDLNKINLIIKKNGPLKIFYFATTKIYFGKNLNSKIKKEYKQIYLKHALKIIEKNSKNIVSFFYPSTSNINENKKSSYSKIKLLSEKKIHKVCQKYNIIFKSVRFPAINSKQSISLLNQRPQSLFNYLNTHPELVDKIF